MKIRFLISIVFIFSTWTHLLAQRPIEKKYVYEKYNLPAEKLDESFEGLRYSAIVTFENNWPQETEKEVRQMILESLRFPAMKRKEMNYNWQEDFAKQQFDIMAIARFGKLTNRKVDEELNSNGSKYRWIVEFKIPVEIEWYYRRFPDRNEKYLFEEGLEENGVYVFKSEFKTENQHYASSDTIISYAQHLFFKKVGDHLKSQTDQYYPYTTEETVVFTTLAKRKMDFSQLDKACETAGEAVSMIGSEDVYAKGAASAKLDEAIAMFEEVYQKHKENSRVKAYPLLNILICQRLQGNITGALETVERVKSMGGMYRMFVKEEPIMEQKELYDLHGVSYR